MDWKKLSSCLTDAELEAAREALCQENKNRLDLWVAKEEFPILTYFEFEAAQSNRARAIINYRDRVHSFASRVRRDMCLTRAAIIIDYVMGICSDDPIAGKRFYEPKPDDFDPQQEL